MDDYYMAGMDKWKQEREKTKHLKFKEKLSYFWYYYKWHTIIGIGVILFVISTIHTMMTNTDSILYGIIWNSHSGQDAADEIAECYLEDKGIDTSKYDITLNASLSYVEGDAMNYQSMQVVNAQSAVNQLDFMTGDLATMQELADPNTFADLREIFTEEELAIYEPYFIYVDKVPMLIDLSQSEKIDRIYKEETDNVVFAFSTSVADIEQTIDFLNYLME